LQIWRNLTQDQNDLTLYLGLGIISDIANLQTTTIAIENCINEKITLSNL
jgi:hypothetical protein